MKGLILLTALLCAKYCIAQNDNDENKKFSLGYDYGNSFPMGSFAKATQSTFPKSGLVGQDTTKLNGYGQKGDHFDLYATYKFLRNFGVTLDLYEDQDNYDINTLYYQYISYFRPNTVAVSTGDDYYIIQYLIGPYVNIHIYKNLGIEFKILAGPTTSNYPSLIYFGLVTDLLYTIHEGSGLGYNFGGGIRYTVVKTGIFGLELHFNVNYAGANITYPYYSITAYTPSYVYLSSSTYNTPKTMSMNMIQATLGVSIEL
jgi:hypothetical protein